MNFEDINIDRITEDVSKFGLTTSEFIDVACRSYKGPLFYIQSSCRAKRGKSKRLVIDRITESESKLGIAAKAIKNLRQSKGEVKMASEDGFPADQKSVKAKLSADFSELSHGFTSGVDEQSSDVRLYNVGSSDYARHKIQPWDIWLEYNLNPWDADIIKRVLRTKAGEDRSLDYEKIIHICKERIRQIKEFGK